MKLDPSDVDDEKGDVAVCRCGLSDDHPLCDGSHRATVDEPAEGLYRYDEDGERRHVERIVFEDGTSESVDEGADDPE